MLNVNAHGEQQEQDSEAEEYGGEEADQQFFEYRSLLGRLLTGRLVRPAHLEHEEPGRKEGADDE